MTEKGTACEHSQLLGLRELSARIGSNSLLVQASTGNTSIKIDDELWIKASGKWLIDAYCDDFLIPVKLARAKRCLSENAAIPETGAPSGVGLRASIETAMHAVLPQKVVVHVHSVNTIAWAVRRDAPAQLSTRLSGIPWQWIPYVASGAALAKTIQDVLASSRRPDVLVLGNHGLVVCGENCRDAEDLLSTVEDRLMVPARPVAEPQSTLIERALSGSLWCVPQWAGVHGLATDLVSRNILYGGVLYPCQAIFLPVTTHGHAPSFRESCPGYAARALCHLIEDHGVLCDQRMPQAEQQMLTGLAQIVQRIEASAPLRYLTASEVEQVLSGEAESYRQAANANHLSESLMPIES